MRVLVTGGAGYIGSHTVKLLGEAGHEVVVYDNLVRGHREAVPGFNIIKGDILEANKVSRALYDYRIEAVMDFAACCLVGESVKHPGMYYENNVIGGLTLLREAVEAGVAYYIFSSSAAVYGEPGELPVEEKHSFKPVNPYGETKAVMENALGYYCRVYGLKYICLRYFNAAGAAKDGVSGEDHQPETHLVPQVLQAAAGKGEEVTIYGDDYPTPDGTSVRDYIHVEDLARAHLLSLKVLAGGSPSAAYNLGSGRGYSVREVIKTAEKVTRKTVPYKTGPRRAGDPAVLVASYQKAERELGWRPRWGLEHIIRTAWEWHRNHPEGYRGMQR